MAVPPLEKTYEFDVNRQWVITETNQELAAEQICILMKDQFLDQSHHGPSGTIAGAGSTWTLQTADRAGNILVPGSEDFTVALNGKYIEITGATNPTNNGVFPITDAPATDTIEYTNAGGVAEALPAGANWRISRGNFTSGPGGQMSPWRCQGSGAGSTGRGSAHDGQDRWLDQTDTQSSTGATSNKSWFVFENTVTGAQMAWTHDSASGSFDFIQMYIRMSPEIGFSGGSNTLHPTASDQQDSVVQADWIGTNTPANRSWHSHLIISNDGHVTFHFTTIANRISQACILQKVPVSADLTGATRPWSGNQNIMMWESYVDSTVWTLDGFTDNAIFRGTIDHAGADGGPYVAAFYATTELASASQLPEVQGNQPTHLDPNKWQFYRMGLITLSTNVRGARGRLLDIFAVNEATNGNAAQGSYYPGDLTRARLKVGHYLLPWNGSTLRKG